MDSTDFLLNQFNYTPVEQGRINTFINWLQEQETLLNSPAFFTNFTPDLLNDISLTNLKYLQSFKSVLHRLEDIHYKTMRSREYKNIQKIIQLVPEKIDYFNTHLPLLENSVRNQYSSLSAENPLFSELFPYAQLKEALNQCLNPNHLTLNTLQELKSGDLFERCRQGIMHQEFELLNNLQPETLISLTDLDPQSKLYNLLAREFFHKYLTQSVGLNIFPTTTTIIELIRPSHSLAKQFNLAVHEGALLNISLNPLPDPGLKIGDRINYFDLVFELQDLGEAYKIEITWPLPIQDKTYYLSVPVYYSHYRLQLINNQRSGWGKNVA